jgi:malate dehydrogenase
MTITTTAPKKTRTIDAGRGRFFPGSPSPGRNPGLMTLRTKTLDTSRPIHVAISGAAGPVGYALLFRIANGGLFGKEQPITLSLLELPERLNLLEAHAMELRDCAFPLLHGLRFGSDPVQMFREADWVILLGGKPFSSGSQSRLDLLRQNAPTMIDHARAINRASPTARVLVVATPCNTNCLIAMSHAQDVPREHWFALNQVIRSRAIAMVADKVRVPVTQVTRLTVWGNNGENAYVDLQNARIGERPAVQVIGDPNWSHEVFDRALADQFREIVRRTGETPAGSTAHAILATIRAITTPTPFEHWFGAGVASDGSYYEVPRGLVFGFPLLTADGKTWTIPREHYLDAQARERIAQNVAELELEALAVLHLLGKV